MRNIRLALVALPLALGACGGGDTDTTVETNAVTTVDDLNTAGPAPAGGAGSAQLIGSAGQAFGSVASSQSGGAVTMQLAAEGVPAGEHGVHIHAVGRCDSPTFETAGPHWNPDNKMHGSENPSGPHRGDLPNVTVGADGRLNQSLTLAGATLADLADADGSALVIHARRDDMKTDPSGESGDRILCAVLAPAG